MKKFFLLLIFSYSALIFGEAGDVAVHYDLPMQVGRHLIFAKWTSLQPQLAIYRIKRNTPKEEELLLDLSEGLKTVQLLQASRDQRFLAYRISEVGIESSVIKVLDLEGKELLEESLSSVPFATVAWQGDGFYYVRHPGCKVYYHRLGTSPSHDTLIYENQEGPDLLIQVYSDTKEHFLFLSISKGINCTKILYSPLKQDSKHCFQALIADMDHSHKILTTRKGIYLLTNLAAPQFRIVCVDPNHPEPEAWQEILPEGEDLIDEVCVVGGRLVVVHRVGVGQRASLYTLRGKFLEHLELPEGSKIHCSWKEGQPPFCFIAVESPLEPVKIFSYQTFSRKLRLFR